MQESRRNFMKTTMRAVMFLGISAGSAMLMRRNKNKTVTECKKNSMCKKCNMYNTCQVAKQ